MDSAEDHLRRVRRICLAIPGATEKLSHGEPTFFAGKRVFAMFSNNHHNDGHIAVCVPALPGVQAILIHEAPQVYYYPAYVGCRGWVGIELARVSDEELAGRIAEAWKMVAPRARAAVVRKSR